MLRPKALLPQLPHSSLLPSLYSSFLLSCHHSIQIYQLCEQLQVVPMLCSQSGARGRRELPRCSPLSLPCCRGPALCSRQLSTRRCSRLRRGRPRQTQPRAWPSPCAPARASANRCRLVCPTRGWTGPASRRLESRRARGWMPSPTLRARGPPRFSTLWMSAGSKA